MQVIITNDEGTVIYEEHLSTDDVVGNPNSRGGAQSAQDRVNMIEYNLQEQVVEAVDNAKMDIDWRPSG